MPTTTGTRRKQYERKKEPPSFSPVADDYLILDLARRHRLINKDLVCAALPHRSCQKLGRRLTTLFDAGWLEKDGVQNNEFIKGGGRHPHVAALTTAGYRALADEYSLPVSSTRWDWNNKRLRPGSIPHILDTTRFAVLARQSAERHRDQLSAELSLDILDKLDVEPPRKSKPLSYTVPDVLWQRQRSTRGIEPDELLRLTYHKREEGQRIAPFLVEIDRSRETIDPEKAIEKNDFWRQSSIFKKDLIYINDFIEARRSGRRTCGHFGFKAFRVLYVTVSPAHMKKMQECEQRYFGDEDLPLHVRPGFILYTNWEEIEQHGNDVLAMPWNDRLGREVYIDGRKR